MSVATLFAAVAVATIAPVTAPVPAELTPDPAVAAELTALFGDLCLRAFPDGAALATAIAAHAGRAVPGNGVAAYLKDDPGHAWRITTPLGLYVVTLEDPPYRACGIRRMTPSGLASAVPFRQAVEAYVAAHDLVPQPMRDQRLDTPSGVTLHAFSLPATSRAGDGEGFILVLSNYHGRPPTEFRDDAKGGVGVEVRFVHQLTPRATPGSP